MGATVQPVLNAGDVVFVAGEIVQGMRPWQGQGPQRLLSYEYVGRAAIASAAPGPRGAVAPVPKLQDSFTPEQRASLYTRGYQDTFPAPALRTDGKSVELAPLGSVEHPSIYRFDPEASNIDHKEFWFWETYGYLIVPGVMDGEWLAAANAAVDAHESEIRVGEDTSGGSAVSSTCVLFMLSRGNLQRFPFHEFEFGFSHVLDYRSWRVLGALRWVACFRGPNQRRTCFDAPLLIRACSHVAVVRVPLANVDSEWLAV